MPRLKHRQRMRDESFHHLIAQARHTNTTRDQHERDNTPFAAVSDCTIWVQLRTAMSALQAGIQMYNNDCLAEAYAMLEHIEEAIRPPDYRSGAHHDQR